MKSSHSCLAYIFAILCLTLSLPAKDAADLLSILPSKLEDASGKKIDASTLQGKTVGLYFSAHWCPPCRAFTPTLVDFRNKHADEDFEIVFVSFDNSEKERRNYIRSTKMKWLSVSGARSKDAQALASKFSVRGYPTLLIFSPDGSIVSRNGRSDVMMNPDSALAVWKKNGDPAQ